MLHGEDEDLVLVDPNPSHQWSSLRVLSWWETVANNPLSRPDDTENNLNVITVSKNEIELFEKFLCSNNLLAAKLCIDPSPQIQNIEFYSIG